MSMKLHIYRWPWEIRRGELRASSWKSLRASIASRVRRDVTERSLYRYSIARLVVLEVDRIVLYSVLLFLIELKLYNGDFFRIDRWNLDFYEYDNLTWGQDLDM